jgi:hypothetical protein
MPVYSADGVPTVWKGNCRPSVLVVIGGLRQLALDRPPDKLQVSQHRIFPRNRGNRLSDNIQQTIVLELAHLSSLVRELKVAKVICFLLARINQIVAIRESRPDLVTDILIAS